MYTSRTLLISLLVGKSEITRENGMDIRASCFSWRFAKAQKTFGPHLPYLRVLYDSSLRWCELLGERIRERNMQSCLTRVGVQNGAWNFVWHCTSPLYTPVLETNLVQNLVLILCIGSLLGRKGCSLRPLNFPPWCCCCGQDSHQRTRHHQPPSQDRGNQCPPLPFQIGVHGNEQSDDSQQEGSSEY